MRNLAWIILWAWCGCDARSSAIEPRKVPEAPPPVVGGSTCEQALGLFTARCTACHRLQGQAPLLEPSGVAMLTATQVALVVRKVSGTHAPSEGLRMPPGVILSGEEIAIFETWAAEGAPAECDAPDVEPDRHHVDGWADPALHGIGLKLAEQNCRECHGMDFTGNLGPSCDSCHAPTWRTDCTYCHGGGVDLTGAPPRDLTGEMVSLTFTAHTPHVSQSNHAPFECTECHAKPDAVTSPGHVLDDTPARAEVDFAAGRSADGRYLGEGSCENLYCHGNGRTNGAWSVSRGKPNCNDCHDGPTSGGDRLSRPHAKHLEEGADCVDCHGATVDASGAIVGFDLHVNRQVDLLLGATGVSRTGERCSGTCHVGDQDHDGELWRDDD